MTPFAVVIPDPTPEAEAHKSLVAGIKSKSGSSKLNLEGKRLVSEAEWILLEEEVCLLTSRKCPPHFNLPSSA